ncbi:MAG: YggT family protein [Brachybacterium sp.]|nr:YggT family protein [Brachybacterium sp.]
MQLIAGMLYLAVLIYLIVLIARLVLEWIQSYAREYRPTGLVLVLFEVVYTLTDPPVKGLRRLIPPLRIGAVSLDLSLMLLLVVGWILLRVLGGLAM